jgi:hypothetical protein
VPPALLQNILWLVVELELVQDTPVVVAQVAWSFQPLLRLLPVPFQPQ